MDTRQSRFKLQLPEMEGAVARWYTRIRGTESQIQAYRRQAAELTEGLPLGSHVLEVAPGPGYLAIEIARCGRFKVTGLDISRTFVDIAGDNARRAAVNAEFREGDVASMPFAAETFDLVVCQAAFKNFALPVAALDEIHRVLRTGGRAVIQDMSREASHADIEQEVRMMGLGRVSTFTTRATLEMLQRRAYSRVQFEGLVAASAFQICDIRTAGIGIEVRLERRAAD